MADNRKGSRTVRPRHLRDSIPVADGRSERSASRSVHVDARHPRGSQHFFLTEAGWKLYSTCFSLAAFGIAGYATVWEVMNR